MFSGVSASDGTTGTCCGNGVGVDRFEWKVEERASVNDCLWEGALLFEKGDDVMIVSGLICVGCGVSASECPGALVAPMRHKVSCVVMVDSDVETRSCCV